MKWKKILGTANHEVSDTGLVRHRKTKRIKKKVYDHDGYVRFALYINGKDRQRFIHRLVAQAFIPNPKKLPVVHHKNGKRSDNRRSNLMWATKKYNRQHAYTTCPHCGKQVKV